MVISDEDSSPNEEKMELLEKVFTIFFQNKKSFFGVVRRDSSSKKDSRLGKNVDSEDE